MVRPKKEQAAAVEVAWRGCPPEGKGGRGKRKTERNFLRKLPSLLKHLLETSETTSPSPSPWTPLLLCHRCERPVLLLLSLACLGPQATVTTKGWHPPILMFHPFATEGGGPPVFPFFPRIGFFLISSIPGGRKVVACAGA